MIEETQLKDLVFDNKNFNKGTELGSHLMDKSLQIDLE